MEGSVFFVELKAVKSESQTNRQKNRAERRQVWNMQGHCHSPVYTAIQANAAEHLGIRAAFASLGGEGRESAVFSLQNRC